MNHKRGVLEEERRIGVKMTIYSQVHKYLDFDQVIIILAVNHCILELKLNYVYELKVQAFSFHLRVFTSKSSERHSTFCMWSPLF